MRVLYFFWLHWPIPIFVGIFAVDFGRKVTDESFLVEGGEVGAHKVGPGSIQAVMIELWGLENSIAVQDRVGRLKAWN